MSDISYVSLFNKYRPMLLSHVIGQEVVVSSLRNAIKKREIPGSILFYGPYGVGKTTIARVLARCINCSMGIVETPCLKCDSCKKITTSSHPDVIEIDAASSTSVDDVRSIIENTKYSPILSRFKIYIIDEVHMLSNNAFNALLKTLEEPMEHAKFILATTEVHKIPFTIISRCQRFQLSKVKNCDIILNLQNVLDKEAKHYDDVSLKIIAANSNGSVRDSLALAEKHLMYSGSLTINALKQFIGNDISELWTKIFANDVKGLLETFNTDDNPVSALNQMLEYLYIIVKIKLGLSLENNEFYTTLLDQDKKDDIIKKFSNVNLELISRMWKVLESGIKELSSAVNLCASTQMLLVRLCYISSLPSPKEIIDKYFQECLHQEPNDLVKQQNLHSDLAIKHSETKDNIKNNGCVLPKKQGIDLQQVKNLLIQEENFKSFFNEEVKKIGILNNVLTLYTEKTVDDTLIESIEKFITSSLKSPWKVEVINLQSNTIVSKILKEFSGAKTISNQGEEHF